MSLFENRRTRRASAAALVAFALLLPAAGPQTTNVPPPPAAPAPTAPQAGEAIPGSYIVVLEDDASVERVTARHFIPPAAISATYHYALLGFTATMNAAAAARLADDPRVRLVEPNRWFAIAATQSSAPWGLDRVDERDRLLNETYGYDTTGLAVMAYVVDSGVRGTHDDLVGRVTPGFSAVDDGRPANTDCNGHGTHVAGTLAGTRYGVAKSATIVPVRVMQCDGSGTGADILEGLDWIFQTHALGQPAVVNMSLGGPGAGTAIDAAVGDGIDRGITFVVAAGNEGVDACGYSPANVAAALTVGATDETDARAPFSNYATCLDLFAPGVNIASAWSTSDTAVKTLNGTSMATPHVAGVVARYLESAPTATPSQVAEVITNSATPSQVTGAGSCSPTSLLYASPTADTAWAAASLASSTLTNATSTSPITYGESVAVSGTLTSDGIPVSCETVAVQRKVRGTDRWKTFTGDSTDAKGRASVAASPAASTYYRLVYRGDEYQAARSVARLVGVRTRVGASLDDAAVRPGQDAALSGKVAPSHAGTSVTLQRYRDGAWRKIKTKTLNNDSRYTFALNTRTSGTYYYRAVKPGHTDHRKGISRYRKLTVD